MSRTYVAQLRSQRGDTLVEVVMAIAIMSAVLVTGISLASNSFRIGMQARERTQAANMAQGEIEKLTQYRDAALTANFSNAAAFDSLFTDCNTACVMTQNAGTGMWSPTACPVGGCSADARYGGGYTVAIKLKNAVGGGKANGTVTVKWVSPIGQQQNVTEVPITLADTRIAPDLLRDCSQAGSATCN